MTQLNEIISEDTSWSKKVNSHYKWHAFFFLLVEGQQTHSVGFNTKDGIICKIHGQLVGNVLCASFSPFTTSIQEEAAASQMCVFFCCCHDYFQMHSQIIHSTGKVLSSLAQSWWLCCCPFDLRRTIPVLMYNFDFLVIRIAVWELISPPPIHPAEVQGYLWNMSIPWFVNIEEVSMLLFS